MVVDFVFAGGFCATFVLPAMLAYKISTGVGVWGNNMPVMWGWDIINFVWWVGVAHAGTLISAHALFDPPALAHGDWPRGRGDDGFLRDDGGTLPGHPRRALVVRLVYVSRSRPMKGMWPQFRSPLMWDVFAVNTYLIVSTLFWYMGLIPDLALMRDRAKTRDAQISLRPVRARLDRLGAALAQLRKGVSDSCPAWRRLLVFTVSSIVGMDFATAQLAGWHETIFPFYFVAGAVCCGFGMVLVLLIPLRKWCHLEDIITMAHIDKICKMTLLMGCIMGYIYVMEFFIAWYSGNPYDAWVFGHRMFGHQYWYGGWMMIVVNASLPQLLLDQKSPAKPEARFRHRHPGQHRHVV